MRPLLMALVISSIAFSGASSQSTTSVNSASANELLAAGDRESNARHPAQALAQYELAIARDPTSAVARWKASREAVDLGEAASAPGERKAFYERAVAYARKAVELAPGEADPHFHLARALGRTALDAGPRDRVKFATEVRAQSLRTLEIAPRHAGALHIMGVWNAEVMRLNGFSRAMAKAFLGGQVLGTASWAEAARYLEQSVAVEPDRAVHHLDLARVYRDMGRTADARREYQATVQSPDRDANDDSYKSAAARELRALK